MIENQAHFVSANEDDSICYYAHCISRTGSYLSEGAGIKEGEPLLSGLWPDSLYPDAALQWRGGTGGAGRLPGHRYYDGQDQIAGIGL